MGEEGGIEETYNENLMYIPSSQQLNCIFKGLFKNSYKRDIVKGVKQGGNNPESEDFFYRNYFLCLTP